MHPLCAEHACTRAGPCAAPEQAGAHGPHPLLRTALPPTTPSWCIFCSSGRCRAWHCHVSKPHNLTSRLAVSPFAGNGKDISHTRYYASCTTEPSLLTDHTARSCIRNPRRSRFCRQPLLTTPSCRTRERVSIHALAGAGAEKAQGAGNDANHYQPRNRTHRSSQQWLVVRGDHQQWHTRLRTTGTGCDHVGQGLEKGTSACAHGW